MQYFFNGSRLKQVNTFQYLGSMIAEDAECSKEIRGKLTRGQSVETCRDETNLEKSWHKANHESETYESSGVASGYVWV